jgi:hypothetical protein
MDALSLNNSELDSLCVAILVRRLEDITGQDTLSEFVALREEVRV